MKLKDLNFRVFFDETPNSVPEGKQAAVDLYLASKRVHWRHGRLANERETKVLSPQPSAANYLLRKDAREYVVEVITGIEWTKLKGRDKDAFCMKKFLDAYNPNRETRIEQLDILGPVPDRTPLMWVLDAEMQLNTPRSYDFPSLNTWDQITDFPGLRVPYVEYHEIDLNETNENRVFQFLRFVSKRLEDNEKSFPCGILSVDTESIGIDPEDKKRLLREHTKRLQGEAFKPHIKGKLRSKGQSELIARIIFGDGYTWNASINLPWERSKIDDEVILNVAEVKADSPLVRFLCQPDAWVGHGVVDDRNKVQDLLLSFYGISPTIPVALEIEALLTLLGSSYPRSNMLANHLMVTGTLLNKIASCADNKWHFRKEELSDSMLAYIHGDIKSGYVCCVVILSLLLRDLFPDPDSCCFSLELNQERWHRYFCSLIIQIAGEKKVYPNLRNPLLSREETALILRGFDYHPDGSASWQENPSPLLQAFCKLLPPWPTVPYGGARSLHQVRAQFLIQYEELARIGHSHPSIKPNLTRLKGRDEDVRSFKKDILFEHSFEYDPLWVEQLPVNRPGLVCDVAVRGKVFDLDTSDLGFESLRKLARFHNREIGPALQEYLRLNPHKIDEVLLTLYRSDMKSPDMRWWKSTIRVYDRILLMYRFLFNQDPIKVPALELLMERKHENSIRSLSYSKPTENHQIREDILRSTVTRVPDSAKIRTGLDVEAIRAQPALNYRQRCGIARQNGLSKRTHTNSRPKKSVSFQHEDMRDWLTEKRRAPGYQAPEPPSELPAEGIEDVSEGDLDVSSDCLVVDIEPEDIIPDEPPQRVASYHLQADGQKELMVTSDLGKPGPSGSQHVVTPRFQYGSLPKWQSKPEAHGRIERRAVPYSAYSQSKSKRKKGKKAKRASTPSSAPRQVLPYDPEDDYLPNVPEDYQRYHGY